MKTMSNTIPSFNLLINVETIFAALCIQYGNQLRRNPATTPHLTNSRLMGYARQCFRGFKKNLKAAATYRDHIKLHRATSIALASSGKEFLAAMPAKKVAAKPTAKSLACNRVAKRASVKAVKRSAK